LHDYPHVIAPYSCTLLTCLCTNRLFSFLHIKAFSYRPYRAKLSPLPPIPFSGPGSSATLTPSTPEEERTPRLASLKHAFSFVETWLELRDGAVYLWKSMRGLEAEPHSRLYHFEAVMGVDRPISHELRRSPGRESTPRGRYDETSHVNSGRRYQRPVSVSASRLWFIEITLDMNCNSIQWDAMLEPFYPLATINELEVEPPSSLLRRHYSGVHETLQTQRPLTQGSGDGPFPPFVVSTSSPTSLAKGVETHLPRSVPQPRQLVMPTPLSPARFPLFQYTDLRIAPANSGAQGNTQSVG
jgi:hypothetical protein